MLCWMILWLGAGAPPALAAPAPEQAALRDWVERAFLGSTAALPRRAQLV